jgi:MFS family permease
MYESFLVSQTFIAQGCKEEFSCSPLQIGILLCLTQIGILLGGIAYGMLSDRYGRILCFKSAVLISAFSNFLLLFSVNYYMMCIAMFLGGIGAGGENCLSSVVFIEFCPPSKRSHFTLLGIFWGAGGCTYSGIAALVTSTNTTSVYDWKYIVAADCLIKLFASIFRFSMVETPTYYYSKGEIMKGNAILNQISIENTGKEANFDNQEQLIVKTTENETKKISSENLILSLFISRADILMHLLLQLFWAFQQLSSTNYQSKNNVS